MCSLFIHLQDDFVCSFLPKQSKKSRSLLQEDFFWIVCKRKIHLTAELHTNFWGHLEEGTLQSSN